MTSQYEHPEVRVRQSGQGITCRSKHDDIVLTAMLFEGHSDFHSVRLVAQFDENGYGYSKKSATRGLLSIWYIGHILY
jgi:hypothetical protein